ncbi:MAG: SDR family oxidoreductase [Nitriliruptorales bacterium]|nr:SDR family oxidoreductase [Nitriliruptorales bacterium]
MSFERALVTGASAGIGRAIAVELAGRGTDLVAVARRQELLEELADEVPVDVEVLPADLASEEGLSRVEERLRGGDAPIDLLVNNAGASDMGRFAKLDVDRAELQIELNCVAAVRLTHAALPGMRARRRGAVLFTSSTASFQPLPALAVYGATKAFLTSFGQALHEELKSTGVTSTVLCPGFTDTDFVGDAIPEQILMDVEPVARAAVDAAEKGRAQVTTGIGNKVHAAAAAVLPGGALGKLAGKALGIG